MKNYLSLFCILGPILMCCCQPKDRVVVEATLDSMTGATYNGRMAYLFAARFNRCRLLDSCRIEKNALTFKATLSDGYWAGNIITSGPEPQEWSDIQMAGGHRIKLTLNDKWIIGPVSGSPDTQVYIDLFEASVKQGVSFRTYRDSLPHITDETLRRQIKDSMDYYDLSGPESTRITRKMIYSIQYATNLAAILYEILGDSADSVTMAEVADYLRQKFPGDKNIGMLLEKDYEGMRYMDHSDTVAKNFRHKLYNLPPLQPREIKPVIKPAAGIKAYGMGDVVTDFGLPGTTENPTNLSTCVAPYVLIDFWATWCGPCCRELPHLIAAKKQYGNQLDIYAVSLDHYEDKWLQYIKEQELTDFIHVLLLNENPAKPEILARFNCVAIPRNFLLDQDRRIIAIDLRGDQLSEKMKELTEK